MQLCWQSFHCLLVVCQEHCVTIVDAAVAKSCNTVDDSDSIVQGCFQRPFQNAQLANQPAKGTFNSDPALAEVVVEAIF